MSVLGRKQRKFTWMLKDLLEFAKIGGYEITLGDAYAKSGHKTGSLHYSRLAIDINLFMDGVYLTDTIDHLQLGLFWESIGGSWGGRFRKKDGNHYSLKHNGKK